MSQPTHREMRTPWGVIATTVLLALDAVFLAANGTARHGAMAIVLATWPGMIWLNHGLDRRRLRLGIAPIPSRPRAYDARSAIVGAIGSLVFVVVAALLLFDLRGGSDDPWLRGAFVSCIGLGLVGAVAHLYAGRRLAAGGSVGRWSGLMRPIMFLVIVVPFAVFGLLYLLQFFDWRL